MNWRPTYLLCLLLHFSFTGWGQGVTASTDTSEAHRMYEEGQLLIEKGKLSTALPLLSRGQTQFEKAGYLGRAMELALKQANLLQQTKQLEQAAERYEVIEKKLKAKLPSDYTLRARNFEGWGRVYYKRSDYLGAVDKYKQAREYHRMAGNREREAAMCYNVAMLARVAGKFGEALDYGAANLKICQEIYPPKHEERISAFYSLSTIFSQQGDVQQAWVLADKALKDFEGSDIELGAKNQRQLVKLLILNGSLQAKLGDMEAALASHKRAVKFCVREEAQDSILLSRIYSNMGIFYELKKQYKRAIFYTEQALAIRENIHGEWHLNTASTRSVLGRLYESSGQPGKPLELLESALRIKKSILGETHPKVAQAYYYLAEFHLKESAFEQAKWYADSMRKVLVALDQEQVGLLIDLYEFQSKLYERLNEPEKVEAYLMKRVRLLKEKEGAETSALGETYLDGGLFKLNRGKWKEAQLYFQQALRYGLTQNIAQPSLLDYQRYSYSWVNSLSVLANLALCETKVERGSVQKAAQYLLQMDSLASWLRKRQFSPGTRQAFAKDAAELFKIAVTASYALYERTGDLSFAKKAFYFSERNKAVVFQDMLQDERAREQSNIPDSLQQLEKNLKVQSQYLEKRIWELETAGQPTKEWQNRFLDLQSQREELFAFLEENYPSYREQLEQLRSLKLEEVQARLPADTRLLEYFLSDEALYVFLIENGNFACKRRALDPQFKQDLLIFRRCLTDLEYIEHHPDEMREYYASLGYKYYKDWMLPFEEAPQKRLIIVPDGPLHYIPFESLLTTAVDGQTPFQDWPYLIKQQPISYRYAASLLEEPRALESGRVLAFAPDYSNETMASSQRAELKSLGSVQQELRDLEERFDGDYFYGANAQERRLKGAEERYGLIHLAMHGLVNPQEHLGSSLVFSATQDETDEQNDGFLYTYELSGLDLNADLVVLSACETGHGIYQAGEGVMSLARGFRYAGVPSLIMTLWQVNDKSSSELMRFFYDEIESEIPSDKALQSAKLTYMAQSDKAHPYYWAGFVQLGARQAPKLKQAPSYRLWFGLAAVSLLLFGGFWWLRRR